MKEPYTTIKLWTKTRKLLRLIAARTDESMVEVMDRLAAAEYMRQPTETEFCVVRSPKGYTHAVWEACGTRADGSLYGFYTLCDLQVGLEPAWAELGANERIVTCERCKQIIVTEQRQAIRDTHGEKAP